MATTENKDANKLIGDKIKGIRNDPNLALLKVDATQAEYWDSPSSKMVQVVLMAKAAVTGSPDALGENKKVKID